MNTRKEYTWTISSDFLYLTEMRWLILLFGEYCDVTIHVNEQQTDQPVLETGEGVRIPLSRLWFDKVYGPENDYLQWPDKELDLCGPDGKKDHFATAFYFLNCLWEEDPSSKKDHWGRSDFDGSIWKHHGHSQPVLKVNAVFDELADLVNIPLVKKRPTVFLSHDIDVVTRAHLEDGLYRLKKFQLLKFIKVILENVRQHQWFNFQKIAELETSFGFRSTFFWIPVRGVVEGVGKNADYDIQSSSIQREIKSLTEEGFSQGIHKSIADSRLKDELEMMGFPVKANRYHYLKYNFSELIGEMNETKLEPDASLGYAQVIGYRNGYSLPFRPFDRNNRSMTQFIEVPLTIMDGTLSKYMKLPAEEAYSMLTAFLDQISEQAVISVLWHNSHFTDHKYEGYQELYLKLLAYFREKGYAHETVESLINRLK